MAAENLDTSPLVVIVGPTASGKTSLAIELAVNFGGEIICADSRTVYRDMSIGTAKPTAKERAMVSHWGLDLVDPGQSFSVADFKRYAMEKIGEIRAHGHIPFLVGGSGLYIDAVIFDFQFAPPAPDKRRKYEQMTIQQLQDYCIKNNIVLPENTTNKRYLVRAIERVGADLKRRTEPISTSIIVGIATDRKVLRQRISDRAEQIFDDNVVEEATMLGKKYGWESEAMTGNIYPLLHDYIQGKRSLEEVKKASMTADWRLAKRQMTWFKRNPYINWLNTEGARQFLEKRLAKK